MSKTNALKRLTMLGAMMAAMMAALPAMGQTNYVFMSPTTHILSNNSGTIADASTFNYNTCVWSGTSGSTFSNNGSSLYLGNGGVSLQTGNLTINGNTIYRQGRTNTYYLRYNSGWTSTTTAGNATAAVYVLSVQTAGGTSTPTISSINSTFTSLTSATPTASANYTPTLYKMAPNSGTGTSYYATDGGTLTTSSESSPTTSGITYAWTLGNSASYDDGHVRLTSSGSGVTVEYYSYYDTDTQLILSVTATHTASGTSSTAATKTITFEAPKVDPTGISITSSNPMTAYVGNTSNITYSLTPSPCYNNVTFSSANTGIASVNGSGVVTGVATGTTTITVTALKIDGTTTSALTKTVSVTVKDKVATPVIAFTPTVADAGATATAEITCSTTGTAIYYTVNGSDPTSSSTQYNGTFSVNDGDIVKAIAIKTTDATYWDNSDIASRTYTACSTTAPVITYAQSGSTATVTITAETGATIYYTTNGNNPTASSTSGTTTVTIPGVASGATVKAFAKNGNCQASAIVSKEIITSGVSGGVVTLYDYEDHTWTYYSGVDASVDGGNYNTNYLGKLYSPNPRNVKITYKANGGAVSIDESETTFVYYKTLEQGATAGQYPYQVISNPFSKRPNGKGFGGWKIKEGADYISGYNDEAILPLDAEIVFTNLPYTSVNCTSAEIELEATWVNYNNLTYASGNTITYSVTGGTYETNFLVLNRNVTGTITVSSPCTIMMVEPDGSTDYRGSYTFTGNITPNNNGVTKIEFAKWNSTNTLNCNNHSVTVGRGMTTTSQCASYVTGVTGATQSRNATTYNSNLNFHLKLESGTFTDVSFIAGTSGTAGYVNCNGTSNQIKGTLGNDYDRAKGDNTKLNIVDELYLGYRPTYANGNQNNALFTCWVKSGNLCSGTNVTNTTFNNGTPNGGYYGEASQCFYVSSGGAQTNIGKRKLYVEGGVLAGIAGGIDSQNGSDDETFFLRMTGGQVRGVVYGSGAFAAASGIRRFIITGGTINGWVAAGCNGTDPSQSGGTLPSDTYIYIGGTSHVGNNTDLTLNTSSDGNVFGAGSGNSAQATTGQVNNSNVVIADECYVKNNVYGGGNYGYSNATATVYVTGGQVAGKVFGGSNQKQGVTVNVNMTGGEVDQGVYGGSNVTGTISGSVTMNINGGQVGTSSQTANIHGGGYGQPTRVSQNVDITLGAANQTEPGVTVYGDVYGGSALGYVNGTAATTTYHTNVTLNKGTINGSLYGGGLGAAGTAANVYGPVAVKVYGGSVNKTDANGANGSGGVYGANNVNGAPQRSVTVDIYGTDPAPAADAYALFSVYGGGNQADYTYGNGYPTVKVHNCNNSIEYVYGGGNAAAVAATDVTIYGGNKIGNVFGGGNGTVTAANVTGNAVTKIYGGTIGKVFGGSNSQGTIGGTISVTVDKQGDTDPAGQSTACDMKIGELYGGGNMAASNVGSLSIGCTGDLTANHSEHPENIGTTLEGIGDVYAGANAAAVNGDVTLDIESGMVNRVFGNNNTSASVSGTITVNIDKQSDACGWYVGYVYGGGNRAPYTAPDGKPNYPVVNVKNGEVSHNVFGGGLGTTAKVTGNPQVTLSGTAEVGGNVYGGGDAAPVTGSTKVTLKD